MDNKICKVVYFDEDSITDYVQIIAGGEMENTAELLKARAGEESQHLEATTKGGIGGVFKALLGWEASASADISAEENSLSYMVMISPYLSMLKTGSAIPAGEFNIAVDKLDNALRNAKGYYEFVGSKGRSRVILRFNINSFKNGYTISDLLKMDLSIYAIKVGKSTIEMLNVNKELGMNVSILPKDNPSYEEHNEDEATASNSPVLDVLDVLLAGVEADD